MADWNAATGARGSRDCSRQRVDQRRSLERDEVFGIAPIGSRYAYGEDSAGGLEVEHRPPRQRSINSGSQRLFSLSFQAEHCSSELCTAHHCVDQPREVWPRRRRIRRGDARLEDLLEAGCVTGRAVVARWRLTAERHVRSLHLQPNGHRDTKGAEFDG